MCFDQWRPDGVQDKLLRQILDVKVDRIRKKMRENQEIFEIPEGYNLYQKPAVESETQASHHRLRLAPPCNSKSPPGTSKVSAKQIVGAIKVWNSMGIEAQEELFRQQFRSAKDVQSLLYVWNEFIAEEEARENSEEVADIPPPKSGKLHPKDSISTKNRNTLKSRLRRANRNPIVDKIEVMRDNDRCAVRYRRSKIRKSEIFKMATKEVQETMKQQAEEEVMAKRIRKKLTLKQ